jgi:hypothetical protein
VIKHEYAFYSKGSVQRRIVKQGILVENIYGISYEEFYRAGRRGPNWQKTIYPLIDQRMDRAACVKWLKDHGLPVPRKSSCIRCPYHDDHYWLDLKLNNPVEFDKTCRFDEFLRSVEGKRRFKVAMNGDIYIHSACVPLSSIDFAKRLKSDTVPMFRDLLCGDHCLT